MTMKVHMRQTLLSLLCRICGQEDKNCTPVYGESGKKQEIEHKIKSCLPVTMTETDNFPKQVCLSCLHKLDAVWELRQLCKQGQILIKKKLDIANEKHGALVSVESAELACQQFDLHNPSSSPIQQCVSINPIEEKLKALYSFGTNSIKQNSTIIKLLPRPPSPPPKVPTPPPAVVPQALPTTENMIMPAQSAPVTYVVQSAPGTTMTPQVLPGPAAGEPMASQALPVSAGGSAYPQVLPASVPHTSIASSVLQGPVPGSTMPPQTVPVAAAPNNRLTHHTLPIPTRPAPTKDVYPEGLIQVTGGNKMVHQQRQNHRPQHNRQQNHQRPLQGPGPAPRRKMPVPKPLPPPIMNRTPPTPAKRALREGQSSNVPTPKRSLQMCKYCKRTFPDNIIDHHVNLHLRQSFFTCIDCNKNFRSEQAMSRHRCNDPPTSDSIDLDDLPDDEPICL